MPFIDPLIAWLEQLAQQVPLTWFTFIGAFLEELIAPIPSPLVMTTSGSIAASQNMGIAMLFLAAVIGSLGKTIASYFIYVISDRAEDFVLKNFGKMVGVSHKEIEQLGKYLNKGWRDDFILFFLRAIPIMPSAPVSVISGVIKVNMRTYLTATFFGNIVRNMFYLYLGYVSLAAYHSIAEGLDTAETVAKVVLAGGLVLATAWFYKKRQSETGITGILNRLQRLFRMR